MNEAPKSTLEAILAKSLEALPRKSPTYVVAVSGGMDSMALAYAMKTLIDPSRLIIAHYNHQTRAEQSDEDASFVRSFCNSQKLKLIMESRFGDENEVSPKKTDENTLRNLRRDFFKRVLTQTNADYIVTAHHGVDQIETLLMRLLRGTGLEGLKAMSFHSGSFVKPFLLLSQQDIKDYVVLNHITHREDLTNQSRQYLRNKVRQDVVPPLFSLTKEFGGEEKFLHRCQQLFLEIQETHLYQQRFATKWLNQHLVETDFWARFNLKTFLALDPLEKQWVLKALRVRLGLESLTREERARLLDGLETSTTQQSLPGNSHFQISCGQVFWINHAHHQPPLSKLTLVKSSSGVQVNPIELKIDTLNQYDADKEWRFFKEGDRFGQKKLKDIFKDAKIPSPERRIIPLLASRNSSMIHWYYPLSHPNVRVSRSSFPYSFDSF